MKTRLPAVTSLFLPAHLQSLLCTFFLLGNLCFGKFRPLCSLSSKSLSKHPRPSQRKGGPHTSSCTTTGLRGLVVPRSPCAQPHPTPGANTLPPGEPRLRGHLEDLPSSLISPRTTQPWMEGQFELLPPGWPVRENINKLPEPQSSHQ